MFIKVSLFLFALLSYNIESVRSDLIILDFKHSSSQDNQELKLCALKKPLAGVRDNSVNFNLINLKNEDGCRPLQPPIDPMFNRSAVYIHTPKTNCPFPKTIENLQAYSPKLVLVGSDGPIVNLKTLVKLKFTDVYFFKQIIQGVKFINY